MAGGLNTLTGGASSFPLHVKTVERSTDNGKTFQSLADIPYGSANGLHSACLVIIDQDTVFLAGGRMGESKLNNCSPISNHFKNPILYPIQWF